jgi:hypothetical protein
MPRPLFSALQYVEDTSACLVIIIAKKYSEYGIGNSLTEAKTPFKGVVPSAIGSVPASMEDKKFSRCTKRKLQLELINADCQLQWLAEQHHDSAFTIQSIQDKLGRIFHLSEGLDIDQFCSTNPFATEA